jgi:HEPN domain-containing protein
LDTAEFLRKGDYVQASEKAWGAASQLVRALAARRGKEVKSHRELHEFVAKISEELEDREIARLWRSSASIHQNFYENWFTENQVAEGVEDVKKFVEKLKQLAK